MNITGRNNDTRKNHLPKEQNGEKLLRPLPNRVNDKTLWDAFRKGSEKAFIDIYNLYFDDLICFGIQYLPIEIVEDNVQDMFIDLKNKKNKLPELKKSIKLFLFQCLKNRLLNFKKRNKKVFYKEPSDRQPFELISPEEEVIVINEEHQKTLNNLDKALQSLNKKQREVIYYFFYQEMGYEEIKELMEFKNIKSARNLLYKVLKKLQKNFLLFF